MAERHHLAQRTAWITLSANLILAVFKGVIGFLSGSLVVLSDAAHSASDVLSTVFVLGALKVSKQPPDEEHPYGHSRAETIAAMLIALFLIGIGLNFINTALRSIASRSYDTPMIGALWISIISILVKEILYRYVHKIGEKIDSPALKADAWHHRTDALSSVAAVLGVFMARRGWPIFDPLMTIAVAGIIIKAGWGILRSTIDELMDGQIDLETLEHIRKLASNTPGVYEVYNLKVHKHGSQYHVDCSITVSEDINVTESHDLTHQVEDNIQAGAPNVTHVSIHVKPRSV